MLYDVVTVLYSKAKACSCGTFLLVKEHQQNLESTETSLGKLEFSALTLIKQKKSLNKLLKAKPSMRSCLHEHFPSSGVREGLEKPTKNFGMQWDREENIIHFFLQSGHSILLSAHMRGRILAVWLLLELKINLPRGNERQQVSLVY